jgi:hypothetical protein
MPLSLNQLLAILGTLALTILLPIALGLVAGKQWSHLRRPLEAWWWLPMLLVILPLTPILLPLGTLRVGLWDQIWIAWFCCAGFAFSAHRIFRSWGRRNLLLLATSLVVGLLLLEGGVRLFLPPPPFLFKGPDQIRMLRFSNHGDLVAEESLRAGPFPSADPETYETRVATAARASRRTLHVGDSMVFGLGVESERTFVSLLDEKSGSASHVNAGFVATGLDYYYLVATKWTELLEYDAVNIYLFLGNDVADMDRIYHFCNDDALLDYEEDEIESNCPEPAVATLSWSRLSSSPPPYLLRVTSRFSAAARQLSLAHYRLAGLLLKSDPADGLRRAELVLRALKSRMDSRGILLQVVLLPVRSHYEEPEGHADALHAALLNICQTAGIVVVDTWPEFDMAVARDGVAGYFLNNPPGDPHLNAAGHGLVAGMLQP